MSKKRKDLVANLICLKLYEHQTNETKHSFQLILTQNLYHFIETMSINIY